MEKTLYFFTPRQMAHSAGRSECLTLAASLGKFDLAVSGAGASAAAKSAEARRNVSCASRPTSSRCPARLPTRQPPRY